MDCVKWLLLYLTNLMNFTEEKKMTFQNTAGSLTAFYILTRKKHSSCQVEALFAQTASPLCALRSSNVTPTYDGKM